MCVPGVHIRRPRFLRAGEESKQGPAEPMPTGACFGFYMLIDVHFLALLDGRTTISDSMTVSPLINNFKEKQ